jgi:hypothetical protein
MTTRALFAAGLVATLFWPAACSIKKVRFTSPADAGHQDAATDLRAPVDAPLPHDAAPHDATAHDAVSHDASARDATAHDATMPDAAVRDAAMADAGPHDAAAHDARPADASFADAGTGGHAGADAGGADAHDAASTDGASLCAVNLVPAMTGLTTPSGAVFSSGSFDTSAYDAWKAFDSSSTSLWISPQGQDPTSIGYAWDSGSRTVVSYAITYANGSILTRAPSAWSFQGLLGDAWITLDSREGETGWKGFERRVYPVASPGSYSAYQLTFTDDNDSTAGIVVISVGQIELFGCPVSGAN